MATDALIAEPAIPAPSESAVLGQGVDPVTPSEFASEAGNADDQVQPARTFAAVLSDYVQLTKPRIVVMILVTTVATSTIAAGEFIAAGSLAILLLGTGAVAASAGAANQIWERVIDRRMTRTARRPLPANRIGILPAIAFTAALLILGSGLLANRFGWIPAAVGVATWLLYVVVYTPMGTRTAWNTTVGAVAGALPMWIGYTACGGSLSDVTAWLLLGVLVAWQYPHFMAIAWMYRRQYGEAGFQMSTTVDPSGRSAAIQSVAGSIALIVCGVWLCFLPTGWLIGLFASIAVFAANYPMLKASIRFAAGPDDQLARRLLRSSLLVLPAVLFVVTLRVFW